VIKPAVADGVVVQLEVFADATGSPQIVCHVAGCDLGYTAPTPVCYGRPRFRAARRDRIPDGIIEAQIVGEVGAAAGLVQYGDDDVGVEVGEVDDVGAAAEGAEGGVPVATWAEAGLAARKSERKKKQIPRCARDDNRRGTPWDDGIGVCASRRRSVRGMGFSSVSFESDGRKSRFLALLGMTP